MLHHLLFTLPILLISFVMIFPPLPKTGVSYSKILSFPCNLLCYCLTFLLSEATERWVYPECLPFPQPLLLSIHCDSNGPVPRHSVLFLWTGNTRSFPTMKCHRHSEIFSTSINSLFLHFPLNFLVITSQSSPWPLCF